MSDHGWATTILMAAGMALIGAVGQPATASAEKVDLLPSPYLAAGGGMGAWHADSCRCIDRYRWDVEVGAGLRWHHMLQLEGGLTPGGMVFPQSGYIPYLGWMVGYRGHLTPPPRKWWENVYVRTGFTRIAVARTRAGPIEGGYVRGGWSVKLWGPFHADGEVGVRYYPGGVMEHLQVGLHGAMRVAF